MIWRSEGHGCLRICYGFVAERAIFDAVITLHTEGDYIRADGFLSKVDLTYNDYKSLYEYIKTITDKDIVFEVILSAAHLYRYMFKKLQYKIIEERPSVTFDGYKSLLVRVRI